MKMTIKPALLTCIAVGLSACGGGGGGSTADLAMRLSALTTDFGSTPYTPEVNMQTGSASYTGVANIGFGTGAGMRDGAYGELSVNVNFAADTLSGSASNFQFYDQTAASGSMTISNGVLTGTNGVSIGSGLTADATGVVAGNTLNMDVEGHFSGAGAEAMFLYLDSKSSSDTALGVGIAVKD